MVKFPGTMGNMPVPSGKTLLNDLECCAPSMDLGRRKRSGLVAHYSIWSCGKNDLQEKSHPQRRIFTEAGVSKSQF